MHVSISMYECICCTIWLLGTHSSLKHVSYYLHTAFLLIQTVYAHNMSLYIIEAIMQSINSGTYSYIISVIQQAIEMYTRRGGSLYILVDGDNTLAVTGKTTHNASTISNEVATYVTA